ncbi:hypothetical protein VPH35_052900 [Triticum aestivum]
MFPKPGDMYTISIFITIVVTTACVEVFMAPRLSFRVSTKLRDGATAVNLSPAFNIDFFSCAMADASLSLGNTMMATIYPALPTRMPALADCLSHDPLHNYPAPTSREMQYIS